MLFLDGVYVTGTKGASARFHRDNELSSEGLTQLAHTLAHRADRYLERQGWLERDAENDYLALYTADDDPLIWVNRLNFFTFTVQYCQFPGWYCYADIRGSC